jgi:hypothetical protein
MRSCVELDLAKMRGIPILVAQDPIDSWFMVEGYTRCTAMLDALHR